MILNYQECLLYILLYFGLLPLAVAATEAEAQQSNSDSCLRYAIVVHMYFKFTALSFPQEFYKDTHKFCPDRAGCRYACNYQDSCQPVLLAVGKWANLQDCGD